MKPMPIVLLAAAWLTASCSGQPSTPLTEAPNPAPASEPNSAVTKVKSPDGFDMTKVLTTVVTKDEAERVARERLGSSKVESLTAELKDMQWVHDNLGHAQRLYTTDSPAWVLTATGELAGEPGIAEDGTEVPHTFSEGKLIVAADTPLVIGVHLYNGGFVPKAADPENVPQRIVTSNPSPSPRVNQ